MKKLIICSVVGAVLLTTPASAQRLTPDQRARLEREVEIGREITRDYEDSRRAYDRAYRAARGVDRAISRTTNRVPGGRLIYEGGQAVGRELYRQRERRRNR